MNYQELHIIKNIKVVGIININLDFIKKHLETCFASTFLN